MGVIKETVIALHCDTCGKTMEDYEKCWVLDSKASDAPYYFCSSKCESLFKWDNRPLDVTRCYTTNAFKVKKHEIVRKNLLSS